MALVIEWGLNEGSGSTAVDSSGNGIDGTSAGYTTGHTSFGAKGDASHEAVVRHGSGATTLTAITFMAWVYPTDNVQDEILLAMSVNENDLSGGFLAVGWDAGGKLYIGAMNTAGTTFFTTSAVTTPINTWVHVAVVWDGTVAALFLDGVQQAGVATTGTRPTSWRRVSAGGVNVASGSVYDVGTVDDVRLFDTGLDASTITTWMNTPVAPGGGTDYTATPADPVGVTDAVSRAQGLSRSTSDPVGVSDTVTASQAFSRATTDPVGVTDDVSVLQGVSRTQVDGVGLTDTVVWTMSRQVLIQDGIGMTDLAAGGGNVPVSDPIVISDVTSFTVSASRTVSDSVGVTDSVSAVKNGETPVDFSGWSNADLELLYLAVKQGATGPGLTDARYQVYGANERGYFSALSGLTPPELYSLADHKLAYYRAETSASDGSLADVSRLFWSNELNAV